MEYLTNPKDMSRIKIMDVSTNEQFRCKVETGIVYIVIDNHWYRELNGQLSSIPEHTLPQGVLQMAEKYRK